MNMVRYVAVLTFFIGFQEYKLHGMMCFANQTMNFAFNQKRHEGVCMVDKQTNEMLKEKFLNPNKQNLSFEQKKHQERRQEERVLSLLALSNELIARDTKNKNIVSKQKFSMFKSSIFKKDIDNLEFTMDVKLEQYFKLAENESIEKREARVLMILALGENVHRSL